MSRKHREDFHDDFGYEIYVDELYDVLEECKQKEEKKEYTAIIDDTLYYIPSRMMSGIQRYVKKHTPPGSFLQAVIQNNLRKAVARADKENLANLPAFISYFYNEAPPSCWGSPEAYELWLSSQGGETTTRATYKVTLNWHKELHTTYTFAQNSKEALRNAMANLAEELNLSLRTILLHIKKSDGYTIRKEIN